MTISSDSARRRNLDRSSFTSARAAWRTGRPIFGEPARGFGFRDDREDLDSFPRDVIKHPHFPDPNTILRLTQAPEAFDPALAYPGRLVPQVPFEGVPDFGPMVGPQRPEGLRGLRRQDDLIPHSSQNIAILGSRSIPRCGLTLRISRGPAAGRRLDAPVRLALRHRRPDHQAQRPGSG